MLLRSCRRMRPFWRIDLLREVHKSVSGWRRKDHGNNSFNAPTEVPASKLSKMIVDSRFTYWTDQDMYNLKSAERQSDTWNEKEGK